MSAALKLECMTSRSNVFRAVVDQCCYGLRDPVTQLWYRKRNALDVNNEVFAAALMKGARCSHRPAEHQPIEGQTRLDGKSVSRSLVAGAWTMAFGKHILMSAAIALQTASCWVHGGSGLKTYVTTSEDASDNTEGGFLEERIGEGVCAQPFCYEFGTVWCDECRKGWCAQCSEAHHCEPADELRQPSSHLALALTEDQEEPSFTRSHGPR